MTGSGTEPAAVERVGKTGLKVRWGDGHESIYAWGLLRARCPCAACRSSAFPIRPAAAVRPLEIQPVGRYAMTVRWSDGHTTGIFSYEYLRSLCPCEACHPDQETEG